MQAELRIGVLVSGGGSNLQAIIDACQKGRIDGRVVFVGSDNPAAGGLQRARRHNIPTWSVDYGTGRLQDEKGAPISSPSPNIDIDTLMAKQGLPLEGPGAETARRRTAARVAAEEMLLRQMSAFSYDLLVLAGFMRLLTPYFIDAVNAQAMTPRIMNIHPALLPAFPGTDGYGDTLAYGCKVAGCTVHFVDYGEDTGPIIGQRAFAIEPEDTPETVRKKGLELEWQLYPQCIQLFARKRLRLVKPARPSKGPGPKGRTTVTILPLP